MIITNDEAALRVVCEPVTLEEVSSLIDSLEKELEYANRLGKNGVGLAAPQIGVAKNIAIIRLPKLKLNLINAKMTKGYDPAIFTNEGCLSFPGRSEDTMRYQEVVISNGLVSPHTFIATGFIAVICQHELDHLNSKLFIDHKIIKAAPVINKIKLGPNEKCYCGSDKKFKKCCGK